MNDLQLALLAVGAIIIAAVILFNWWQEHRIRRETVRRFEGPVDDVLMAENFKLNPKPAANAGEEAPSGNRPDRKVEPTISLEDIEAAETSPGETAQDGPAEDSPSPFDAPAAYAMPEQAVAPIASEAAATASLTEVGGDLPASVDVKIDLLAVMVPAQPCSGEKLRETLLSMQLFGMPGQWLGLNADNIWCQLEKHQEPALFSRIVGSLQLADRSGAVSKSTLNNFQLRAKGAAEKLSATLEWSGQVAPYHYAQELDQFCIGVDVMVGLHLVPTIGPFAGTKLRGLAEAGGMTLHDDGTFVYVNESGETLFILAGQDDRPFSAEILRTALVPAVTLQLDVPRVKNFPEVFNKMVLLARRLEQGLNAKLVDDNQLALGDAEIEKIRQRLKAIYGAMAARSIMPGSSTALRLFS